MKYFSNFPFLTERYKSGFFTAIINKYCVQLAYFSKIANVPFEELIAEVLRLLFSDDITILNNYSGEKTYDLIAKKDKLNTLDKGEFFKLRSDDHCIITAIFLYLRSTGNIEGKKAALFNFIKLLYVLRWFSTTELPAFKIWKVSSHAVFLSLYSIGEMHDGFATIKKELKFKIYHAEMGKLLQMENINLLKDYEKFISDFLKLKDKYCTGQIKSLVNNSYTSYRMELQYVNNIKELINAGII